MKKKLEELLSSNTHWNGGVKCRICIHAQKRAIDADYAGYYKLKAKGHAMPWEAFFRYLREEYNVDFASSTFSNHGVKCLKLEKCCKR